MASFPEAVFYICKFPSQNKTGRFGFAYPGTAFLLFGGYDYTAGVPCVF